MAVTEVMDMIRPNADIMTCKTQSEFRFPFVSCFVIHVILIMFPTRENY